MKSKWLHTPYLCLNASLKLLVETEAVLGKFQTSMMEIFHS